MNKRNKEVKNKLASALGRVSARVGTVIGALDRAGAVIVGDKLKPFSNGIAFELEEGCRLAGCHLGSLIESWKCQATVSVDLGAHEVELRVTAKDGDPIKALEKLRASEEHLVDPDD